MDPQVTLNGDNPRLIDEGIKFLKKLKDKIEKESDLKSPKFMMVLIAIGSFYQRKEDKIYIVPINMLKG